MKKKFLSFMLAICLIIPCAFALVACGKTDNDDATAKVMNISLNPQLEFVLDKNDKVLSVNALNEDGNHIISLSLNEDETKSLFEGMTADEAVELFLENTEENGYIVTGDEEEIKIEISGKADNLMKKVKEKANKFFTDNGLDISIITDKIEKDDIVEEVKKCMKEYTETELETMTQEQLIELLKGSREETKNLLTQELKESYYNMRAEKINIAELEELLEIINGLDTEIIENSVYALLTTFADGVQTLLTELEELENTYATLLTGAYEEAKQAYIQAKEALLAQRLELGEDGLTDQEKLNLEEYETAVENAKQALEDAKDIVDAQIALAKQAVEGALDLVKTSINSVKTLLSTIPGVDLTDFNNAKQNAKDGFKNHFDSHENFDDHVGHNKGHWGKEQPAA